jgi:hypothetical protein
MQNSNKDRRSEDVQLGHANSLPGDIEIDDQILVDI